MHVSVSCLSFQVSAIGSLYTENQPQLTHTFTVLCILEVMSLRAATMTSLHFLLAKWQLTSLAYLSRSVESPCRNSMSFRHFSNSSVSLITWNTKNVILIKDTNVSQTEINSLSQDKDTILIFKWFLSTAHKIYFVYVLKYHYTTQTTVRYS